MRAWLDLCFAPALRAQGLALGMLTLTQSHRLDDDYTDTVARLKKAQNLWNSRSKRHFERAGIVGKVVALEVTTGENGLHAHLHILMVYAGEAPVGFQDVMGREWLRAVADAGGSCSRARGCLWQPEVTPSYIIKELAAHDTKTSGGLTLPRLLDASRAGDRRAGQEWLRAVKALGGHSRFHVGRLAKTLGIDPPSAWVDQESIDRIQRIEAYDGVTIIEYPQTLHVAACRPGRHAAQAMLLRAAQGGEVEKVVGVAEALVRALERAQALRVALAGVTPRELKCVLRAAHQRPLRAGREVELYTLARRCAGHPGRVAMVLRN